MVLGNHEFDYPQETLLENVKTANFPVLAGNLQFGNGSNQELKNELVRDYIVETVAVSYTHLDVYKRQGTTCATTCRSPTSTCAAGATRRRRRL